MAYSDFTLEQTRTFRFTWKSVPLFTDVAPVEVPAWLTHLLKLGRAMPRINDKARIERDVVPVLMAALDGVPGPLAVFAGMPFDVDREVGLFGPCDHLLCRADPLPLIQNPVAVLASAVKDDIHDGLGPAIAQMFAARLFRERDGLPPLAITGCVTNGHDWQVLRLRGDVIEWDPRCLSVRQLGLILAIFRRDARVSADLTTASLPPRIGRYQLLAEVGRGGMGTVYRAHDPNLDRVVALKVPHAQPEHLERFQREARAAARVLHPNVCPIFDVGEHEGAPYVVMAFVEGHSLTHYLESGAALAIPDAVGVAAQVLDALAAVHAAGLVHRDVKPGNVLIDAAGRAILTDFGLAQPEGGSHLTSTGVVVGTPAYMAPEQAAGRSGEVGPATDVYAAGMLLYRMLAGRVPFEGAPAEVVAAVLRDEPPSPRQFRPEVDLALEAVVARAMAKRPGDRFPTARAFADALAAYAATFRPAPPEPPTLATPAAMPAAPDAVGWEWWVGWGVGFVLAAGVGMLQAYWTHGVSTIPDLGPGTYALVLIPIALGVGGLLTIPALVWFHTEAGRWPAGVRRAARAGWAWVVRTAAANRVDLDEPDRLGDTALMIAAAKGHEDVVKALLFAGARVDVSNSFNQTAAEVAYSNGRAAIYDVLQRAAQAPRPARPAVPTRRVPPVSLILLAALLTGTLAFLALAWRNGAWPVRVEWSQAGHWFGARDTQFGVFLPEDTRPSPTYPRQLPDVLGELKKGTSGATDLLGRRFVTTPEVVRDANHDIAVRSRVNTGMTSNSVGWPWVAPWWWGLLALLQAVVLWGLAWLVGFGWLFGVLPRRPALPTMQKPAEVVERQTRRS